MKRGVEKKKRSCIFMSTLQQIWPHQLDVFVFWVNESSVIGGEVGWVDIKMPAMFQVLSSLAFVKTTLKFYLSFVALCMRNRIDQN